MLAWTQNVQETFNVFFSSFDVISVLSFYQKLNHTVYFWSSFHLCLPSALLLSRGNKSWAHVTNSGAAALSSHPLNFQITKINKTLPTSGMKGTSFWRSPTRITGAREDGKGRCGGWGVRLCRQEGFRSVLFPGCDSRVLLARTQDTWGSAQWAQAGTHQGIGDPRSCIIWQGTDLNKHPWPRARWSGSYSHLNKGGRGLASHLSPAEVSIKQAFTKRQRVQGNEDGSHWFFFLKKKEKEKKKIFQENSWPALVVKPIIQPLLVSPRDTLWKSFAEGFALLQELSPMTISQAAWRQSPEPHGAVCLQMHRLAWRHFINDGWERQTPSFKIRLEMLL